MTPKNTIARHPHFKNVAKWHGAVGEAMDKQRLQDSLPIVEGMTHTGNTVENREFGLIPDHQIKVYF